MNITPAQMKRLQTCCSQMARTVVGFDGERATRLAWAKQTLGREVASFSELTIHDARRLIDAAQGELGHRAAARPGTRERRSAAAAHRAGVDGRKGDTTYAATPQIVSAEDLDVLAEYYARLGWNKARFDAWLASSHSPIGRSKTIRTQAQANRVRWALQGMLKDAGLWVDWSAA